MEDGSGDSTEARLREGLPAETRLCALPVNQGRAAARAQGAAIAGGDVLVFLDCDCLPGDTAFLQSHMDALDRGAVASTGPVRGTDNDFWDRYQAQASATRARRHAGGLVSSGSSQNLAVLSKAYFTCGGFDPKYRHYGFEDRDLLERIAEIGPVAWTEQAQVNHLDTLSLAEVASKMRAAGAYSAPIFRERFTKSYHDLGYARIDVSLRPFLAPVALIGSALVPLLSRVFDWLEKRRLMAWPVGRLIVKATSGLSFLVGTWQGTRRTASS